MKTPPTQHIEITPDVCGGQPRVAGHRIRVQDIAIWHERLGQTPDDIVARYPELSLADVHAALTYYFDHREEIQRQIRADRKLADELQSAIPSKMTEEVSGRDSVSS